MRIAVLAQSAWSNLQYLVVGGIIVTTVEQVFVLCTPRITGDSHTLVYHQSVYAMIVHS